MDFINCRTQVDGAVMKTGASWSVVLVCHSPDESGTAEDVRPHLLDAKSAVSEDGDAWNDPDDRP